MRLHVGSILPLITTVVNLRVARFIEARSVVRVFIFFLIFCLRRDLLSVGGTYHQFCLSTSELPFSRTSQSCDSFLQLFSAQLF